MHNEKPNHLSGYNVCVVGGITCVTQSSDNTLRRKWVKTKDQRKAGTRTFLERVMPMNMRVKLTAGRFPVFVNISIRETAFALKVFCYFLQNIPLLMLLNHKGKYLPEIFDYADAVT
ncbi:hypothetical protein [Atlantibacter sp.]|uniref:hypothetical protein n=1 Tax=Atlantibacter sp. TaxID=1903473 RepID=UPI0028AB0867|nr:hypothetical protein [Atlantibacter sp.]